MSQVAGDFNAGERSDGAFLPTRWSVVLAAAGPSPAADARMALDILAHAYWRPVFAYIRGHTRCVQEAEDLTQSFFTVLLEKHFLALANPQRGRFRAFLLTSVKHFLANQREYVKAEKRGGKIRFTSINDRDGGADTIDRDGLTPEQVYARQWALDVLDRTMQALREEYQRRGRLSVFENLKDSLCYGQGSPVITAPTALGVVSAGATRVAIHRLRRRYREILRTQIAETVANPADIDEEIRFLIESL